ncbi:MULTISPECIES: hypothetical protein [Okeania]|uniref:hypothetical protein n=1 Tax=Okeania TaxID=1458928 RepID=UPI000F51B42B|nr:MULTISPECIES: hypothetical protein [Okeania]NES91734.1 hypothetical protein [Okeania sp. SIO2B9]NET16077.1 hypothetical protein [Okeania sp. SIO1H6]NET21829.1 hypothetical protein [Okeania sp. SIO1H5]NET78982.1 hypothetical protein [Okeania sp. SIO1F9]NET95223.1 hypothetical protein [Okeania sp. SIO1H2]
MQRCPKCNSEKLMHNVRIIDRGHNGSITPLEVEVFKKPDAIFLNGHTERLLRQLFVENVAIQN